MSFIRRAAKLITIILATVYLRVSRRWRRRRPRRIIRATSAFFGHLALEPENYLSVRASGESSSWAVDINQQRSRDWWTLGKLTSSPNAMLAKAWRRQISTPPSWWVDAVIRAGESRPGLALPQVNASLFGVGNALDATPTQFRLSPPQLHRAQRELLSLGVDLGVPYVALVVRDEKYFDEIGNHLSDGRMRNRPISDFVPAVAMLAEMGVQVIRLGHLVASKLDFTHPLVFDYATSGHRSELLDVYIPLTAKAVVSTLTGSDAVALVGRRPVLYVDVALYAQVFHATSRATWIPAQLRDIATNRTLSLAEVFGVGVGWFVEPKQFDRAGIEVVRSSPAEIGLYVQDFIREVLDAGEYRGTSTLQQQARESLSKAMGLDGQLMHGDVRSRISDQFLLKFPKFLG